MENAGCIQNRRYKSKPFWCPELSAARDKKRFWWQLWVQNGRPRSGEVFKCYKGVKKLFRGLCRRSVKSIQTNDYRV